MSNYQLLLQKLNQEPQLQYLKQDYNEVLGSMENTNLSLKQMIAILLAAEKDSYKFTQEIDRLTSYIKRLEQELDGFEGNPQSSNGDNEYKEIIYEYEEKLFELVDQLSQNGLIEQMKLNDNNMQPSMCIDILGGFVQEKCINKKDEMVYHKKKNFELQLENMKMLSNLNPKEYQKKMYSRERVKQRLLLSLRQIKSLRQDLSVMKTQFNDQVIVLFKLDDFVDKLKTNEQFQTVYSKIVKNLKQFNYHKLNTTVRIGLQASKDLNSKDIFTTFSKLQTKFNGQFNKTIAYITKNLEDICKQDLKDTMSISRFTVSAGKQFLKCEQLNNYICDIYKDKDYLEKQVRIQLEEIIFKLNNENHKFKMLILTKTLEKRVLKNSLDGWSSLKSIHY